MANAGGAWDNAKKIVETELKMKGTPLHDASVVGDTVGDPFKDTSSVSMNPVIKFTTLFGLLAVEIAVEMKKHNPGGYTNYVVGGFFFLVALWFVYRSFYQMRIPEAGAKGNTTFTTVRNGPRAARYRLPRAARPTEPRSNAEVHQPDWQGGGTCCWCGASHGVEPYCNVAQGMALQACIPGKCSKSGTSWEAARAFCVLSLQ